MNRKTLEYVPFVGIVIAVCAVSWVAGQPAHARLWRARSRRVSRAWRGAARDGVSRLRDGVARDGAIAKGASLLRGAGARRRAAT
uniref:hypothetical protein n=1 Tax=Nonomuraea pusilla TaxID=46177 RepID=UPI0006E3DB25|nr:hypothetical protein [Nonomuraea pusilla]